MDACKSLAEHGFVVSAQCQNDTCIHWGTCSLDPVAVGRVEFGHATGFRLGVHGAGPDGVGEALVGEGIADLPA